MSFHRFLRGPIKPITQESLPRFIEMINITLVIFKSVVALKIILILSDKIYLTMLEQFNGVRIAERNVDRLPK
jgi:hypothetical protein